jgi:hypothetical protein
MQKDRREWKKENEIDRKGWRGRESSVKLEGKERRGKEI